MELVSGITLYNLIKTAFILICFFTDEVLIKISNYMKKINFLFIIIVFAAFFVSCNDDSEDVIVSDMTFIKSVYPSEAVEGQTIYIEGNAFEQITQVILPGNISVTDFKLVGFNQISLVVPKGMEDGYIILKDGEEEYKAPIQIHSVKTKFIRTYPDTIAAGEVLTIRGDNLSGVTKIKISETFIVDALYFKRKSDVELQVIITEDIPVGENLIKMVTLSGSEIGAGQFYIKGSAGPKPPKDLEYEFYTDGFANNWQDWGWGRESDPENTEFVRVGEMSLKTTYTDDWGGVKFANVTIDDMSIYREVAFSVYGAPGSDGVMLQVTFDWNTNKQVNIVEGEWTDFVIPLDELGSPATISELTIQAASPCTVYFDHIGLR